MTYILFTYYCRWLVLKIKETQWNTFYWAGLNNHDRKSPQIFKGVRHLDIFRKSHFFSFSNWVPLFKFLYLIWRCISIFSWYIYFRNRRFSRFFVSFIFIYRLCATFTTIAAMPRISCVWEVSNKYSSVSIGVAKTAVCCWLFII